MGDQIRIAAARVVTETDDPPRLPRLYSARSLAERLNVSKGTVRGLYRSGRLRGWRIDTGGPPERQPLRFSEGDVIALLREVQR